MAKTPLHQHGSKIDVLTEQLAKKLSYKKGERDMVAMHHILKIEWQNGKREVIHSSFIRYGDAKHSAMAYTVGTPCAIATQLILDNKINVRGVLAPVEKEVYEPINNELYKQNIRFTERHLKE